MTAKQLSEEEIQRALDLTEAAHNLAGIDPVNDPWFEALQRKVVTGEISGDDAATQVTERYSHRWTGKKASA